MLYDVWCIRWRYVDYVPARLPVRHNYNVVRTSYGTCWYSYIVCRYCIRTSSPTYGIRTPFRTSTRTVYQYRIVYRIRTGIRTEIASRRTVRYCTGSLVRILR